MIINNLHAWDLAPKEAAALQNSLREKIVATDCFDSIRTIAGADIGLARDGRTGVAGVIIYEYPSLAEVTRVSAAGILTFPYVPGLLSFRESPLLLEAFSKLSARPDLAVFDGQGIAHPRRFGIASHMGLLLGIPTIGCAKSVLTGSYREPARKAGSFSLLKDNGETIGAALRTRDGTRCVFVSTGHRISLRSAVSVVAKCADGLRIPKPTREADRFVKAVANRPDAGR